jgi:hypothetical protein
MGAFVNEEIVALLLAAGADARGVDKVRELFRMYCYRVYHSSLKHTFMSVHGRMGERCS